MRAAPLLMALMVIVGLWFWVGSPIGAEGGSAPPPTPAAQDAEQPPVKVVAFRSEARAVESAVLMRGRTEAFRAVEVRAETAGLVASQPLRAGAAVSAGDPICRLDAGARELALVEARAALAQAEADARAADTLAERGLTAENTAIARRAAREAAAARLRTVELDIDRLTITAPFDGVLETDAAEIGELLRVGDLCARLIALDPVKIVGFVAETEVDRLEPGMTARARLVTGREVMGEISFVSRASDEMTRTFRVEITAPNPDRAIRDGITAEIAVPLDGGRAHLVPQSALTLDDAGRLGIRVAEDGRARFLPARVLREEANGIWLAGLPETVDVIYVGQEYVSDGRAVEAVLEDWSAAR